MPKAYLNPPGLFNSRQYGFSQVVTATGGTSVYVSGQVGWNEWEQIEAPQDLFLQTRRAFQNLAIAMQAAGGSLDDIVSLRLYIVGEHIHQAGGVRKALLEFFDPDRQPASTWIGVPALASPDFLIEVEAVAVIDRDG